MCFSRGAARRARLAGIERNRGALGKPKNHTNKNLPRLRLASDCAKPPASLYPGLRQAGAGDDLTMLDSVESALAAIAAGELVVVVDDTDRENEGDLIMA